MLGKKQFALAVGLVALGLVAASAQLEKEELCSLEEGSGSPWKADQP
jgi:hypothetical protein